MYGRWMNVGVKWCLQGDFAVAEAMKGEVLLVLDVRRVGCKWVVCVLV